MNEMSDEEIQLWEVLMEPHRLSEEERQKAYGAKSRALVDEMLAEKNHEAPVSPHGRWYALKKRLSVAFEEGMRFVDESLSMPEVACATRGANDNAGDKSGEPEEITGSKYGEGCLGKVSIRPDEENPDKFQVTMHLLDDEGLCIRPFEVIFSTGDGELLVGPVQCRGFAHTIRELDPGSYQANLTARDDSKSVKMAFEVKAT